MSWERNFKINSLCVFGHIWTCTLEAFCQSLEHLERARINWAGFTDALHWQSNASSWGVPYFSFHLLAPGSRWRLDFPSISLSTSSTIPCCFLAQVCWCICQGSLSCSSHVILFLLYGCYLREFLFFFFRNCEFGHEFSRAKGGCPLLQRHFTLRRADSLHRYEQD